MLVTVPSARVVTSVSPGPTSVLRRTTLPVVVRVIDQPARQRPRRVEGREVGAAPTERRRPGADAAVAAGRDPGGERVEGAGVDPEVGAGRALRPPGPAFDGTGPAASAVGAVRRRRSDGDVGAVVLDGETAAHPSDGMGGVPGECGRASSRHPSRGDGR